MRRDGGQQLEARQYQPSPTRRRDINQAILELLESGPRTASRLRTEIRVGVKHHTPETAQIWRTHPAQTTIHGRTLAQHLAHLQRDGWVACEPWLKILHHGRGGVCWVVKYYVLQAKQGDPTPLPEPFSRPTQVSEIHNPFKGEEGMLQYIRWRARGGNPPHFQKQINTYEHVIIIGRRYNGQEEER